MAAKNDKSSKTSRVMSLVRKGREAPAAGESEAPAAPLPPIIDSIAPDAAISGQIKNALEEALGGDMPAAPAQPSSPAPAAAEPAAPAPAPALPVDAPAPVEAAVKEALEYAQEDEEAVASTDFGAGYVNVMQVLVEEKAPKYVKMFGTCSCQRCMEDIKALALNHLPPKYVVLGQNEMIPKLTFYEGQYSSDITAQLLKACSMVMQRPHHDR